MMDFLKNFARTWLLTTAQKNRAAGIAMLTGTHTIDEATAGAVYDGLTYWLVSRI
ncbi:MAG: hypothetical protein IT514_16520 [Burkholderiales bacterium]|nr:hypothetical protein [Burkholderiales bacterium]